MLRFLALALPLLLLVFALFGVVVESLDLEPRSGPTLRLGILDPPRVAPAAVLAAWTMQACGLAALYLLVQGRLGRWWLDGLVTGWVAWVFRGPLLVVALVVAARFPQDPWWRLSFAWFLLYAACGLLLAWLGRQLGAGSLHAARRAVFVHAPPPRAAAGAAAAPDADLAPSIADDPRADEPSASA
ncbi:MAG: hypothetical protein AAGN46_00915 [Acidobacteriota bacterium]